MNQPFQKPQRPLDNLKEEDWKELWNRLRLFTYKKFGWLRYKVKGGFDLELLITESIEDIYLGVRCQPPDVPTIKFICEVIRSKAYHIWEKEKKQNRIPLEDLEEVISKKQHLHLVNDQEDSYRQVRYTELSNRIRELVEGDDLLTRIVEVWIAEPGLKPRDIADVLDLDDIELRNAQKRLRRKVQKLKRDWTNE